MIRPLTRLSITFFIVLLIGLTQKSNAQSVSITASNTSLGCGGGNIQLNALGSASSVLFSDDFNTGTFNPNWTVTPASQFNNPCGASLDGSAYLWMGASTNAPR